MRLPVSRPKLSYANIVSTICLFLLLGGGAAFAATQHLAKNSVGSRQLRKGAVTPAKLAPVTRTKLTGLQGPAGPRGETGATGATGPQGAEGAAATKLFAQVRVDGTVNSSSSPITVKHVGPGNYLINFGQDVTRCVAIANQGAVPNFDTPGSNTGAAVGYGARADITSGGAGKQYAPGYPTVSTIGVATFSGFTESDSAFQIAVLC
jgi:hypothetical protein